MAEDRAGQTPLDLGASLLLPIGKTAWTERDTPIMLRGVDGRYLRGFLNAVREGRDQRIRGYEQAWRLNVLVEWDPPFDQSEYERPLTSRNFVHTHVLEWTASAKAPLLARVPEQYRGRPTLFLSYTWDSDWFANGWGVIEALSDHLRPRDHVWMDVFCHNQHNIGSVADQMEAVISGVDRLLLPMSQPEWYQRAWCIWEVLCAIKHQKPIQFLEYGRKLRDYKRIRQYYLANFRGIEASEATVAEDKELIIAFAKSLFGSIAKTDRTLEEFMEQVIGPTAP